MIKKICFSIVLLVFIHNINYSQAPVIEWQKTIGGSGFDGAMDIQQTIDGGYIVTGTTDSTDGDFSSCHGNTDTWVIKTNEIGTIEWQKCIGGSNDDFLSNIKQTTDGGYILFGTTNSNDGDVIGLHGSIGDLCLVKLTSMGTIEWQRCYGSNSGEQRVDFIQTIDGGYIIFGYTTNNLGDVIGFHGAAGSYPDALIYKIDSMGNIEWQKCIGGTGQDDIYNINQTNDGGYILAGETNSNDGDVAGNHGLYDAWLVKLNSMGNIEWQKCIGGTEDDNFGNGGSELLNTDGSLTIFGSTSSIDGDLAGNHVQNIADAWAIKLTANGTIVWQKCLKGNIISTIKTSDGNYILAGNMLAYNSINGFHTSMFPDFGDGWVVKLNSLGTIEWQKCIGGSGDDYLSISKELADGGYLFEGGTTSSDGDVFGFHLGGQPNAMYFHDIFFIKVNNFGIIEWQKCIGGTNEDSLTSFQQTTDGGFVCSSGTSSNDGDLSGLQIGDAWLFKLSPENLSNCNFNKSLISIYPNPAQEKFTIDFGDTIVFNYKVKINNLLGQEVYSSGIDKPQFEVHKTWTGQGLYFVSIIDAQGHTIDVRKIILQ